MSKEALDRVRLEERAKMLAKASQEVSRMISEMSASDNPKKEDKPKATKTRGSQSLGNLSQNSVPSKRGGSPGKGNVERGRGGQSSRGRGQGDQGGRERGGHQINRGGGEGNQSWRGRGQGNQRGRGQDDPRGKGQGDQRGRGQGDQRGRGQGDQRGRGAYFRSSQQRPGLYDSHESPSFPPSYEESMSGPGKAYQANIQPINQTQSLLGHVPPLLHMPLHNSFPNGQPQVQNFAMGHPYGYYPQRPFLQNPVYNTHQPIFPQKPNGPPKPTVAQKPNVAAMPLPKKSVPESGAPVEDLCLLLIKELVKAEGFFMNVEQLANKLNRNYDEVLKKIDSKKKYFSKLSDESANKVLVELCPTIKICKDYLGPNGCATTGCLLVHICPAFVLGNCREKNCLFGHFWKSDQNSSVFRHFSLDDIPLHILHKLMKKVLQGTIFPKICSQYNSSKCELGVKCTDLHICEEYVKALGICPNRENCISNHNIQEQKCKLILENHGICTNESPRDLLKILSDKLNNAEKITEVETGVKNKKKKEKKEKKSTEGVEKSETNKSGTRTVFVNQLYGTVHTPLICSLGIQEKCPDIKEGCKFLHSKLSSYWQFGDSDSNKWYNFHVFHSKILDSRFTDANCDKVTLPKLDPEKVYENIKALFSLLGNKAIEADFTSMTVKCEVVQKVYSIRNVTTPSSAICDDKHSTEFCWYFQDNNNKWESYGDSEALLAIEKAYHEDVRGTLTITLNEFSYKIDFPMMYQQNIMTDKKRSLRRRTARRESSESKKSKKTVNVVLPQNWEKMDENDNYQLVNLSKDSDDFRDVSETVEPTFRTAKIVNIFRVENIPLWNQFMNKQTEVKRKYKSDALNIQHLFHGIDTTLLSSICSNNLDWRIHEPDNTAKPYGQGTYFYTSASAGARNCQVDVDGSPKMLLVFDVILGLIAEGSPGLTRPPLNPEQDLLYDTTADSATCPAVFVKYDKQEYYPAYVIEFR